MLALLKFRSRLWIVVLALTLCFGLFLPLFPAHAATFTVANGDVASLILAINTANAQPGADTIVLATNGTYTLSGVDNATGGNNGLPVVSSDITIEGNGATIAWGGPVTYRLLYISATGNLKLNNLTLRNGNDSSGNGGGAVYNASGSLTITGATIASNASIGANGGGIFSNGGSLTIANTTFNANSSVGGNGGAIASVNASLSLSNSTFTGNSANLGGGLYNAGTGSVTNVTFFNNLATTSGGAIYQTGAGGLTVTNATLATNAAANGPGIFNNASQVTLRNSIVANNPGGGTCAGAAVTGNNNLEFPGPAAACGAGSSVAATNPLTGGPGNNGGPTQTIALAAPPGNPAINGGNPATCASTDQRYFNRVGICDIGAFEYNGTPLTVPSIQLAFTPTTIAPGGTSSLSFTLTNPNTVALTGVSFGDNLPAEITVAAVPATTNTCTGGTLSASGNTISATGVTVNPGSCVITVNVTSATLGSWNTSTGPISARETGAGLASNQATLFVSIYPTVILSFSPGSITTGGVAVLKFTVTNPAASGFTNLTFSGALPGQLKIATPSGLSNTCGSGTLTAPAGGNTIAATGINLAANQSCTITVNVTGATPGSWTITLPAISTNETGNLPNPGRATLQVRGPVTGQPADFVAQLRVTPDRYAATEVSNLIIYKFKIRNIGPGLARSVHLIFPVEAGLVVGYASFPDPREWVSAIVIDVAQPYMVIDLPAMDSNDSFEGTLVFRPKPDATAAATVFSRYTVKWDDDLGAGKQQGSNGVRYRFSTDNTNRDDTGGAVQLFDPATGDSATGPLKFTADFFAPGELVSIWFTGSDGNSAPLGTQQADAQGRITVEFKPETGQSGVVAGWGNRSEVTGSGVVASGT